MPDCHTSAFPGFTGLQSAALAASFQQSADQLSSFSTNTEQCSPPYSGSAGSADQAQYSTPESHYTDRRTDTPSSDQLNIDFSAQNGYSPDDMDTTPASEGGDESPDSLGSGTENHGVDEVDMKPLLGLDSELQRQLLRMQGMADAAVKMDMKPSINLLQTFNNNLFNEKLAASLGMPQFVAPTAPNPMATAMPQMPCDVGVTKRKTKRQRRNPVWPYFDVIDGTARCKQCLYSTKSVFSTNLKVHLRSHHRADYEKVIQAEDALNLNALLLSGNSSKLFSTDLTKKRMPPMTSSIIMTLNKLVNQQNEDNPLQSVLRQSLASGNLQQQLQQFQQQLQKQQQTTQPQLQSQVQQLQSVLPKLEAEIPKISATLPQQAAPQPIVEQKPPVVTTPQPPQPQQSPITQFPLNAANLAALNQLARSNPMLNQNFHVHAMPAAMQSALPFMNQFNFQAAAAAQQQQQQMQQIRTIDAPHGTDANGVPQPKRRRLRRHPVWMFFKDLEDRMVGCINCNFRTGSAFSTNLKMHLKAHHKEDYERVLKLEDEMRIEEGIFGPPNKIKTELIDFIRGGGNASTPPTPNVSGSSTQAPKASPLVQQIINQTAGVRPPTTQTCTPASSTKEGTGDDDFSSMSMSDRLAALVGLAPPAGSVPGEIAQEEERASESSTATAFEELRRAAERIVAANMGLAPPQQEQTLVNFNGTVVSSETKSTSSASTDGSDDRKTERDRAFARFWMEQGGSEEMLNSELLKDFIRSLAPDYEMPDVNQLVALAEEEGSLTINKSHLQ